MNIIVTGTSRGIGYEVVKTMAEKSGMNILAIARDPEGLKKLKKSCSTLPSGDTVHTLVADLSRAEHITHDVAASVHELFDSVDILINNAGYLVNKPFMQIDAAELEKTMNINFKVPWQMIQSLVGLLEKSGHAHVINISSIGGMHGSQKFPGLSAYSSAKGALGILTECLAEEFRPKGIAVNCLALGSVQTEMFSLAFPGYNAQLSPDEVALFITDFALKGSRYFNGKILPVSITTP